MEKFNGEKGFYVKNSFGDNYAIYPSEDHYLKLKCLPSYIDNATALADCKDILEDYYLFKINKGNPGEIEVTLTGEIIGTELKIKDYLLKLFKEHGKESVKYSFEKLTRCITTN